MEPVRKFEDIFPKDVYSIPEPAFPTTAAAIAVQTATFLPLIFPTGLIIDGHEDVAWNSLEFGRDPLVSALASRKAEAESGIAGKAGPRTTGLAEWISGRVGIVFATLFVMPAGKTSVGTGKVVYHSAREANDFAQKELQLYQDLEKKSGSIRIIAGLTDLAAVLASWREPGSSPQVGLVLLMEGADPILKPEDLAS